MLKAEYHLSRPTRESLQRGLTYVRQAIEADPGYADAYALMSFAYGWLGIFDFVPPTEAFPKSKAAAQKALEIDDSLANAHSALGFVRLYYEWDWSGAEQAPPSGPRDKAQALAEIGTEETGRALFPSR